MSQRFIGHDMAWVPVVEAPVEGAFLCEDPAELMRQGRQADVPVIIGANSREGLLWYFGA